MGSVPVIAGLVAIAIVVAGSLLAPVPGWWAKLQRQPRTARRSAIHDRLNRRRPLLLAYVATAALAAVVLLVWGLPSVLTRHPHITSAADRHTAITDTRTSLVAVLAAIGAAGGLAYTARTYRLSREGQITDRYSRAAEQLTSDRLAARLGGIYAMERLMRDSPADQPAVLEILAAYVRQPPPPAESRQWNRPTEDVQAALTVLGRRKRTANDGTLDLRGVQIQGAELSGADLSGAELSGADLAEARLTGAKLEGATLVRTDLSRADLTRAILVGADLDAAKLRGSMCWHADFRSASLGYADLSDATLWDADLSNAELVGATFLDVKLDRADLTAVQVLPGALSQEQLGAARNASLVVVVDPSDLIQP
jgi:hypothetical protein